MMMQCGREKGEFIQPVVDVKRDTARPSGPCRTQAHGRCADSTRRDMLWEYDWYD